MTKLKPINRSNEVVCKSSAAPVIDNTPTYDPTQFGPGADETVGRSKSKRETIAAARFFDEVVAFDRYQNRLNKINRGEIQVVNAVRMAACGGPHPTLILNTTQDAANANFKKIAQRLGPENLGPWSDFEWGMINGKLSALRWVLGDGWDNLDT